MDQREMAKKKPVKKDAVKTAKRMPRKVKFSPADISLVANAVREIAGDIDKIAAEMKFHGIETIAVDGAQKPKESFAAIDVFIRKAKLSMDESKPKNRPTKLE